jgi:hypothetical protein
LLYQHARGFAIRERRQLAAIPGDELAHAIGRGISVLAQRPSDRLADEEFLLRRLRAGVAEQARVIGLILVLELRDDRGGSR